MSGKCGEGGKKNVVEINCPMTTFVCPGAKAAIFKKTDLQRRKKGRNHTKQKFSRKLLKKKKSEIELE